MKIANIILDGRFGGPQNRILQVSEILNNYGIETVVIIPQKDSYEFYSKLVDKNIHVKKFSLHGLTKYMPQLIRYCLFFIPEVYALYKYLKRENIPLVHCNSSWQITGFLAGKIAGAKVIWHLNDSDIFKGVKIIFNVLAPLSDGFIVASTRTKEYYLSREILRKKNIIEIQGPVNTSSLNPYNIEDDKRIGIIPGIKVTTVANINPTKGIEYFIDMACRLHGKYENLFFYIVGGCFNSQKNYLKRLAQTVNGYKLGNVIFYGQSNNIASVLKSTDIFVCTSIAEASPLAVWEAMAMEKAIVCTDVGDVRRFIIDGENGFVVPTQDTKALVEKVEILIEDENLRIKLGKRAREVAVKELDIKICAQKHKEFYLKILRKQDFN